MTAPPPRRPMDWVTAWSAALPVYGLAAVLHAIFPLFAVPAWIIFFIYGRKILDGARIAEDPWRGRGNPRSYLMTSAVTFAIHFVTIGLAPLGIAATTAATSAFAGFAGLASAALFLAGSAPPGVRAARSPLRLGLAFGVLSGIVLPGVALRILPGTGPAGLAVYVGEIALAALSFAGFETARRRGPRLARVVARKVPR